MRSQAFELLHRAAVLPFGLGLIAQKQAPGAGLPDQAAEAFGEGEVAVLGAGDFQVADDFLGHGDDGLARGVQGLVEAGGEQAGFQAGGAEQGLLRQGNAFEGEPFLGVDGAVEVGQVGLEVGDGLEVFQADDGEVGGGESVAVSVLGGAGLALGGAGAGGAGCIGAIGGQPAGGEGAFGGGRFRSGHRGDLPEREIARGGAGSGADWGRETGNKGVILLNGVGTGEAPGVEMAGERRWDELRRVWQLDRSGDSEQGKEADVGGVNPGKVSRRFGDDTSTCLKMGDHLRTIVSQ